MEEEQVEPEIETVETTENDVVSNENNVDHNWQKANAVLSAQKRQIEELEQKLNQMNQPQVQPEIDEFDDLDQDDYMTVGKAREMANKLASKAAEKTAKRVVDEYIQQQNISNDEARMKSKHDDYDFVIENYAIPLIKNDPALAYKVQMSKNPAETAYRLGKLSDSYEAHGMKKQTSPLAEKVMKNVSRPVSSNSVSSPLKTQASDYSKMSREDVWAQSQKFARMA